MKHCNKCNKATPAKDFYKSYVSTCKWCCRKRSKQQYISKATETNGLYRVWTYMKERCYSPNSKVFKYYGGKGIGICPEWRNDFRVFYAWAKGKHKRGLTIDRRNNDGDYSPENCRFITQRENNRNRGANKLNLEKVIEIRRLLKEGKLFQREIAKMFGVNQKYIGRIKSGERWS